MENQKKIPSLRFPEFSGEWKMKKLAEIAEVIMGQSPEGDSYNTEGIGVPLINGPVEFTEKHPVKIKWTSKPSKYCQDKDVLFCVRGSTTGRMNIANDKYCIGRGVAAIRANNKSSPSFVELILIKNLDEILTFTTGSTFQNIDSKSLKEFQSNIPSFPEQQKIATFLTAIEEKLTQLKKRKALLEQYKKGVMQKIFSQEIRFKDDDGKDFPDWERKRIDNFAPLQRGFDLPVDQIEDGDYPVVFSNGILKYHKEFKVKAPGIVTGRSGTIGKVTYVEIDYWPHNTSLWVTDFKGNFPLFIFHFFNFYRLERFGTGSGVPTLNRNDIHDQIESFPSYNEQTKIANFISAIDDKINHTTIQVDKAQQWKKGLLQQMFC